jgi:hypothetical protein
VYWYIVFFCCWKACVHGPVNASRDFRSAPYGNKLFFGSRFMRISIFTSIHAGCGAVEGLFRIRAGCGRRPVWAVDIGTEVHHALLSRCDHKSFDLMNLIPLHPHPDPEISSVVGQLTARLAALGAAPGALIASLVGSSPGPAADDEFPSHDAEALYQMAAHLCNEGDFARALPIALYLTMGRERKPHHVFMAASCLQRLEQPDLAVGLFGMSGLMAGEQITPAPLLRSGECLAAMGRTQEAIQAFESAIELARDDAAYMHLQAIAEKKAQQLRSGR